MKGLLFLGAIGFLVTGAYNLFIEVGVWSSPRRIEIGELEARQPWNRHLTITGSKLLVGEAVRFWKTSHGVTLTEEYYIPIKDKALEGINSVPPSVLVKASKTRMNQILQGGRFNVEEIQGIRMTSWDIEGKVKELLEKTYGERAAKRMLIIDLERAPTGLIIPLGGCAAGIALLVLTVVPWETLRRVQVGKP